MNDRFRLVRPNSPLAWHFSFNVGSQGDNSKNFGFVAWAVRSGDVSVVPVPAAVWLFGSALGPLGWMWRKAK